MKQLSVLLLILVSYSIHAQNLNYGDKITMKTIRNRFAKAQANGLFRGDARADTESGCKFIVVNPANPSDKSIVKYGQKIALKSVHNKYVVAEKTREIKANRGSIGAWEKWTILQANASQSTGIVKNNDGIILKSHHNTFMAASFTSNYDIKAGFAQTNACKMQITIGKIQSNTAVTPPSPPNSSNPSNPTTPQKLTVPYGNLFLGYNLVDINNDGWLDLVGTRNYLWFVAYYDKSKKRFGTWKSLRRDGNIPYNFGDFDGNGKADATYSANNGDLKVSYNSNSHVKTLISSAELSGGDKKYIIDVNGDKITDIFQVKSAFDANRKIVYKWRVKYKAKGTWVEVYTSAKRPFLAIGDFDGNGKADALRIYNGKIQYRNIEGNGSWITTVGSGSITETNAPYTLTIGDLDGDGRSDLIHVNPKKQIYWSSNATKPWRRLKTEKFVIENERLGAADINGDGKDDLVYTREHDNVYVHAILNPLAQNPVSRVLIAAPPNLPARPYAGRRHTLTIDDYSARLDNKFFVADFDGDGFSDLFKTEAGSWWIAYNAGGTGNLQPWRKAAKSNMKLSSLKFGDFNGDKKTDVFAVFNGKWNVSYGGVGSWKHLNTSGVPFNQIGLADFNGNGKTDVFRASPTSKGILWQVSYDGKSGWKNLYFGNKPLSAIRFGDFNKNGKADIFYTENGRFYVCYDGTLAPVQLNTSGYQLKDMLLADANGDGKTDVIVSNGPKFMAVYGSLWW